MPNKIFHRIIIAGIVLCWLSSCITQRKALDYMNKHGFVAASYCAAAFPIRSDSVFLPGKVAIKSDTIFLPGDSILCPDQKPGQPPAVIHCPPSFAIHDTLTIRDTLRIEKENPAKDSIIAGLQRQNAAKDAQLEIAQAKAAHRGKLFWGLLIGIVLVIGGYFFVKSRTAFFTSIIKNLKK